MPVIPALGMLEQEDAMSLNPACALYSKYQARQGDVGKTPSQEGEGGGDKRQALSLCFKWLNCLKLLLMCDCVTSPAAD